MLSPNYTNDDIRDFIRGVVELVDGIYDCVDNIERDSIDPRELKKDKYAKSPRWENPYKAFARRHR